MPVTADGTVDVAVEVAEPGPALGPARDGPPTDTNPYVLATPADRGDAIGQLCALVGAVQAELGRTVAASEAAGDWRLDGATDMAAWLVGSQAITRDHAREVVRVAHALEGLPALRQGLAGGRLSWDQVRPATRFATPEDDAEVAGQISGWSAAQVERLARRLRPRSDDDGRAAHQRRRFGWRADHHNGGFRYSGFLPADAGARVNAVLQDMAEKAGPAVETGLWDPFSTRCADALHDLACGDGADTRSLVVIHTEANVVSGAEAGNGDVDDVAVNRTALLRYLCDSDTQGAVHRADGTYIGIGRRSRTIPPWLRRAIVERDRTCRFPGCERPIRHVHHIEHWIPHGRTDAPNLAGHCWHHHHLVHEGGWTIEGDADHQLTFVSPLGRRLTSRRQPLRGDVRARTRHLVRRHRPPGCGPTGGSTAEDDPDPPP